MPPVKLRDPFPPETIGKLPKVNCRDCIEANKERRGATCDKHRTDRCDVCNNWITRGHIHLDYVGHAEVTDRLLTVDPKWTWEPYAIDGGPALRKSSSGRELNLWIALTVEGVTRIGVGSVAADAFDAEKQLIGDALRNAAMRFGVALDLWAKTDLESAQFGEPIATPSQAQARAEQAKAAEAKVPDEPEFHDQNVSDDLAGRFDDLPTASKNRIRKVCHQAGLPQDPWSEATDEELERVAQLIDREEAA